METKTTTLSITSLVLAATSTASIFYFTKVFLGPVVPLIFGIIAICFSKAETKRGNFSGCNTAGLVLGIIGTVVNSVLLLLSLAVVVFAVNILG